MSTGMSQWHSATNFYRAMDRLGGDQLFETIDARQRELDDMRKMNRATTLDRNMRASSFFDNSTISANRFERGHSIARLDVNDTKGRPGSSNWSGRTRSTSISLPGSTAKRGRSEDFSSSTRGNLTPQLKILKLDSTDMTPQSSSITQSFTSDDGVFVKPTMPSITRLKPPRIYSSEPISRSRLTIPKRRFSPEPESKYTKVLPGLRRPAVEIVELTEVKGIIKMTPATEFDLPTNFTPKQKKRISSSADVTPIVTAAEKVITRYEETSKRHSMVNFPALQQVETVEFSLPISFIRDCTRARSLSRTPAGPSNRMSTRLSSQTPEGSQNRIVTRSSNRKQLKVTNLTDDEKTGNIERLCEEQTPPLSQGTSFGNATVESSKTAIRSRLTRKTARENEMKVIAKVTTNAEGVTKEEIVEGCKIKEEVNEDENIREMEPQVKELSQGDKEEAQPAKEEASVKIVSNPAVGASLEVGLTGEEEEKRGSSEDGDLNGTLPRDLSLYEDDDEDAALHIVESTEDDEVASSEERVVSDSDQQTPDDRQEASKVLHGELLLSQSENE